MKFFVVNASGRKSKKVKQHEAVVCEECALKWVKDELLKDYLHVHYVPASCHWTAQIVPGREFSDWDQKTEES